MLSLYLHFPFCKRKCSYCDFCSAAATDQAMEQYCDALAVEIALQAAQYGGEPVDTVFLGGGTPSLVPAPAIRKVLTALRRNFHILSDAECSSEANPGTLTDAWLDVATEAGVNRLSIGVQAKQMNLLRTLERIHTYPEALEALRMAREHGIENLNADAMFGLPGQTLEDYLETLHAFVDERVTHVSAYALIVEDGTPLAQRVQNGSLTLPDEDMVADMLEQGVLFLETHGYQRYEISNFAKPGYACKHNLGYWRQKRYLGLGLSAASLLPAPANAPDACYVRQTNTNRLPEYLRQLACGRTPIAETQRISRQDAMFETVMLGLRTVEGVRYGDFMAMYGQTLPQVYGEAIDRLTNEGLLAPVETGDPRLRLTPRGLMLQNTALMAFMRDTEKTVPQSGESLP